MNERRKEARRKYLESLRDLYMEAVKEGDIEGAKWLEDEIEFVLKKHK